MDEKLTGTPVVCRYTMNREDILIGLRMSEKIPKGRMSLFTKRRIQLVLSGLLGLYFAVNLVLSFGVYYIVMTSICILLFLMIYLLPDRILRNTASLLEKEVSAPTLSVYENGIDFSDKMVKSVLTDQRLTVGENEAYVLFITDRDRIITLPKRGVGDGDLQLLLERVRAFPRYFLLKD